MYAWKKIVYLLMYLPVLVVSLSKKAQQQNPLDLDMLRGVLGGGDCTFQCYGGIRPIPKRGHKPKSNGCGVEGMHISIGNFQDLEKCCDAHDFCYDTCNRTKKKCDKDFEECLESRCDKSWKGKQKENCKNTAKLMVSGADMFGCEMYKESQKNACDCKLRRIDL